MLRNTFLHIPGIGPKTEALLWSAGIESWDDLDGRLATVLPPARARLVRQHLEPFLLSPPSPRQFAAELGAAHLWRLFPACRRRTAYLDIETTGLDRQAGQITTIGLFDGKGYRSYVHGRNLEKFVEDIAAFEMLVTYNGRLFDLPFLEHFFAKKFDQIHVDLRFVLHSLGIKGGLKNCERRLGLHRGPLDGVDGFDAVRLWHLFRRTGNPRALDTLLAYNLQDVATLETLMVTAFNRKLDGTPFAESQRLPTPPPPPPLPFAPDPAVLRAIGR